MKDWEKQLKKPFRPEEIEWREARSGVKDGKGYVIVLAYITSRAVMDRLDDVFGVDGWTAKFEFQPLEHNGKQEVAVICTITAKVPGEEDKYIVKQDGAPLTNYESIKGGISDAFKRAAVQLGIGRYLYRLPEYFIWVQPQKGDGEGWHYTRIKTGEQVITGYWKEPELPEWALPDNIERPEPRKSPTKHTKAEYSDAQFGLVAKLLAEILPDLLEMEVESHDIHRLAKKLLKGADKQAASKKIDDLKQIKDNLEQMLAGKETDSEAENKTIKLETWARKELGLLEK